MTPAIESPPQKHLENEVQTAPPVDTSGPYTVTDISLAEGGEARVSWARSRMPALAALRAAAESEKPLTGQRVAGCLHVTKETAVLIETLRAAGAEVSWSGCNPLSTQDDVAAWLAREGYDIHAWYGQSTEEFYRCIDRTLELRPTLTPVSYTHLTLPTICSV